MPVFLLEAIIPPARSGGVVDLYMNTKVLPSYILWKTLRDKLPELVEILLFMNKYMTGYNNPTML
jgi:hypothetical protein